MLETMLATVLAVLAAAAPSVDDRMALEEKFVEIFKPYGTSTPPAAWDQPIYSADVAALIAKWRSVVPESELDGLNDGDWLCQCQDWDEEASQATITSIGMASAHVAEVEVTVDLGFTGPENTRRQTLVFKREDGVWKLDEIAAPSFPNGLKQALRETIAEDEALRSGERG